MEGFDLTSPENVDSVPESQPFPNTNPLGGNNPLGPAINGLESLGGLVEAVAMLVPEMLKVIGADLHKPLLKVFNMSLKGLQYAEHFTDLDKLLSFRSWIDYLPTSVIYREMLDAGLNVKVDEFDESAQQGVRTVEHMLAFAMTLPFIGAAIDAVGTPLLANRWGKVLAEMLSTLPEEMGLSWALGLTIDDAFRTAVGSSINEGINRQKRGNRIEWQVLRSMMKQHLFADHTIDKFGKVHGTSQSFEDTPGMDVLRGLLENQGFPDEQIDWIMALSDQLLPIGDLQAMYLAGLLDEKQVREKIIELGFNKENADLLMNYYVQHTSTQAASMYRATARTLYRDYLISENHYRDILKKTNFPKKEIEYDIDAIKLEHDVGRIKDSATVIKAKVLHNQMSVEAAVQALVQIGYATDFATEVVATWSLPPIPRLHGITESKVLSYFVSGVLTREQASLKLRESNLNPDDVKLLLDHPQTHSGVAIHKRTPSLVIQAYLDGVLHLNELEGAFKSAGVPQDDMQLWLGQAKYRYAHRKAPKPDHIPLDRSQILAAYKYGIFDGVTTVEHLGQLGYDSTNALILLEIENKGPFRPVPAPLFNSLDEAIAYMEAHGYNIIEPPSPYLLAAEQILAEHGYSWSLAQLLPSPPLPIPPPTQPTPQPTVGE